MWYRIAVTLPFTNGSVENLKSCYLTNDFPPDKSGWAWSTSIFITFNWQLTLSVKRNSYRAGSVRAGDAGNDQHPGPGWPSWPPQRGAWSASLRYCVAVQSIAWLRDLETLSRWCRPAAVFARPCIQLETSYFYAWFSIGYLLVNTCFELHQSAAATQSGGAHPQPPIP